MLGISVVLLALGGYASGGAAEGPYPGFPRHTQLGGSYVGVAQGGVSQAAKARQWAQVPMQAVGAYNVARYFPYDQPDPLNRALRAEFTVYTYLVAPAGSEHNYGMSPTFTVRTVAFGAIPTEATLQLIQRRGSDGLPLPIIVTASEFKSTDGTTVMEDTKIEDVVTLRVTRLVVDGVDLRLGKGCQTAQPGKLSLLGKGFSSLDDVITSKPWLTGNFAPGTGGLLAGTVDVPAFGGCVTASGEDVSQLLTRTVSGPGNDVRLHVSGPGACNRPIPPATGGTGPPRPGDTTLEAAGCAADQVPPQIPIP